MKKLLLLLIVPFLSFGQINYETEIQPIFNAQCIGCHQGGAPYCGGLSLTSYEELIEGGFTEGGVIATGVLDEYITTGYMPAYGSGNSLSDTEINLIVQWVFEGALNNNTNTVELISPQKTISRTINIFGQETTNKGFQLEIYDDGSVEKKYLIK